MMGRYNFLATTCCVVVLSLFAQSTWASPLLDASYPVLPEPLLSRQAGPIEPGGKPCGQNNATNRGCWRNQWNVSTDYEFFHPPAFNNRVVRLKSPSFRYASNTASTTFVSPTSPTGRALMELLSMPCSSTVRFPNPMLPYQKITVSRPISRPYHRGRLGRLCHRQRLQRHARQRVRSGI